MRPVRTPAMRDEADQGPEIDLCNCWKINYGQVKAPRNYQLNCEAVAATEVAEVVAFAAFPVAAPELEP